MSSVYNNSLQWIDAKTSILTNAHVEIHFDSIHPSCVDCSEI